MHHLIKAHFEAACEKYQFSGPYLEIGAGAGMDSILSMPYFKDKPARYAINMTEAAQDAGIDFKLCNSNNMHGVFADRQFATIFSNAVLEHDQFFWRSVDEMHRVLMPGGFMIVGAPGFIPIEQTAAKISGISEQSATITMDLHSRPDYWRFSRWAFTQVICAGLEILELRTIGQVPRLVCVARKPLD